MDGRTDERKNHPEICTPKLDEVVATAKARLKSNEGETTILGIWATNKISGQVKEINSTWSAQLLVCIVCSDRDV